MKLNLFLLCLLGSASFVSAQAPTTISVTVNSSLDDHEERINGSVPQTGTLGAMDAASSDLELGNEAAAADPQLVGVRFTNLTIPANAIISKAYIQFAVDATAKNTDPCILSVRAEDNANPVTFSDSPFSLSSRTLTTASVTWTVSGSTWGTVGSAGVDQQTPDLKTLVQALVNKPTWTSGNAMAFFIQGNGTREVESFDGDVPAKAPKLVVEYSLAVTTGLAELSKSFTTLYPNPFKNSFEMNLDIRVASDVMVSVYDMNGNVVEEFYQKNAALGSLYFKSSVGLSAGVYIVKARANNQQQVLKLIAE
jgi:hypothetical protein